MYAYADNGYYSNMDGANIGILKRYTDNYYKLVSMRPRSADTEKKERLVIKPLEEPKTEVEETQDRLDGYSEKLLNNIARAKSRVFEIALCNDFELFVTLTVNAAKCDRYSLDAYYKKFSKWLNNYNMRMGTKIKYLFVPEQHKDGAWHLHGLLLGLPSDHITQFTLDDKITRKMRKKISRGDTLYNWPAYADKFGWVSMEPVKDSQKCAGYISKYIVKQAENVDIEKGDHLYYCSKGLKRAEVVYRNTLRYDFVPDYVPTQEYVKVKIYEDLEQAMLHFCDSNEITTENDIFWKMAEWEKCDRDGWHYIPDDVRIDLPWEQNK